MHVQCRVKSRKRWEENNTPSAFTERPFPICLSHDNDVAAVQTNGSCTFVGSYLLATTCVILVFVLCPTSCAAHVKPPPPPSLARTSCTNLLPR